MRVFHLHFTEAEGFHLWAEDGGGARSVPPRRGRPPRIVPPRDHPFACPKKALRTILADLLPDMDDRQIVHERITLLLPSVRGGPLASRVLTDADEAGRGSARGLAPWRIPSVRVPAAGVVDLLLEPGRSSRADLRPGSEIAWWSEVVRWAVDLVIRGRLLPDARLEQGRLAARWTLCDADLEDVARRRALAAAMPPVCRAGPEGADEGAVRPHAGRGAATIRGLGWEQAPAADPQCLLERAGDRIADALVRERLPSGLLPPRRGRPPAELPVAEAWMLALTGAEATVAAPAERVREFLEGVGAWHRTSVEADEPFRLCLQVSEPAEEDEPWRIEVLLQATDDRSLILPVDQVWKAKGRTLQILRRRLPDPQEFVIGRVGTAARVFPPLGELLTGARPRALEWDTAAIHRFLREGVPLLEQAGFGLLVPGWWRDPARKLGLRLTAKTSSAPAATAGGGLGLQEICSFHWEVSLGGESIPVGEFRRLARLKVPLVRVRGQWIELESGQIAKALSALESSGGRPTTSGTAMEALRVGLGLEPSPGGLPVVELRTEGWLKDLIEGGPGSTAREAGEPDGFSGRLRHYQRRGLAWLDSLDRFGLGACLADDMGLGKTIQLLALLALERTSRGDAGTGGGKGPGPTLLVAPMSVVGNWEREAERFTPGLRVHVHHGAGRPGGAAFRRVARGSDLVITTYALVARDAALLEKTKWRRIVLDEAQNIKNRGSRQAQAVCRLQAGSRVALTGTPVENRLDELWSLMDFLNPGLLGSRAGFRRAFAIPIERYRDAERAERLRRITSPFILRRLKSDRKIVRDLPRRLEFKTLCNLSTEQGTLYQAVVDEMLERIESSEGIERRGLVLSTMLRLKQVCNHPALFLGDGSSLPGRSGKLERLEEILDEVLEAEERALIFTQYTQMGDLLHPHLRDRFGCEVLYLHGGTSKRARDRMVARFQDDSGPPLFLLSLKAGGTGLNLTQANHVVHFDRWWNPAVEQQATDRAHRIGQRRDVQVRAFLCVGTLEERIDRMIEEKKDLADRIVGAGEQWLTEMSTGELREVFRLDDEAVGE